MMYVVQEIFNGFSGCNICSKLFQVFEAMKFMALWYHILVLII